MSLIFTRDAAALATQYLRGAVDQRTQTDQ